jgi:hypothetical protein
MHFNITKGSVMQLAIKMIRKIKANLIRLNFHIFCEPLSNVFVTLAYISKLSKWVKNTQMPEFDDFYLKHHNHNNRYDLYDHIVKSEDLNKIYYIEFGVAQGSSFKWWVNNITDKNSKFVGFDTFTGLPEDWGYFKRGAMSAKDSFPDINDKRCKFVKGIFQETLPYFLKEFDTNFRKVINLDADLYSSTLFALTMMGQHLRKGDILIFDEFNVPLHEFRAFTDFINSYYVKTKVIGAVNNYHQTAFKVEENLSYCSHNRI